LSPSINSICLASRVVNICGMRQNWRDKGLFF
jgi:hypothetical protein